MFDERLALCTTNAFSRTPRYPARTQFYGLDVFALVFVQCVATLAVRPEHMVLYNARGFLFLFWKRAPLSTRLVASFVPSHITRMHWLVHGDVVRISIAAGRTHITGVQNHIEQLHLIVTESISQFLISFALGSIFFFVCHCLPFFELTTYRAKHSVCGIMP